MHDPIDAASVFAIAGPRRSMGMYGITWDTMGVNGSEWIELWEIYGITRRDLPATGCQTPEGLTRPTSERSELRGRPAARRQFAPAIHLHTGSDF